MLHTSLKSIFLHIPRGSRRMQRGISLLELIFALAVIAMIVLFAAGRYKQSQWDHDLAVTQRSVQTLLQALNQYFYENCNKTDYQAKFDEVGKILTDFNPEMIANPFGQPFQVQIEEMGNLKDQPIYRLKLMAEYSPEMANTLRERLGADAASEVQPGIQLFWSRLPSLSMADPSAAYWIQTEAFNQGATASLRAYERQNPGSIFLGVCDNRGPKP